MSNEVFSIEEKLRKLLLSKQFFFQRPQIQKVWLYLLSYFSMLIVGLYFNVWYITTLFTVYLLTFLLAAKGPKLFLPVVALSFGITFLFSDIYAFFWIILHILISVIIYLVIINRHSKMIVVFYTAALIFFSSALFVSLLIKMGHINYNPEAIQNYINNYVNSVISMQPSLSGDKDILFQSFEEIKRFFPTLLFMNILLYSLILIQYSMFMLSKDKVIIPVFPKASSITVNNNYARFYVFVIIVSFIVTLSGDYNPYSTEALIVENVMALLRWLFIFNGLFTIYFYLEIIANKNSIFSKILLFIGIFFLSFIYEIIGFIDSIMRFRESYKASKGGKL